MNLTGLRQKIKNITDYSPELAQFDDQMDELINDAFYELWSMKRWNFATKTTTLDLHTDITPYTDLETGATQVNANVTYGQRQVTLSFPIRRLTKPEWEGQPISIQNQEYIISKVAAPNTIYLQTAFQGDTKVDDVSWVIKKRYYTLPEDCLELLYAGYRDYPYNSIPVRGKATGLLPRTEEDYDLRGDFTNDWAEAYIPSPSRNIPSGEVCGLEETAVSSDLTIGYYELCWAFVKDGMVGPLSQPDTLYLQEGNSSITVNFKSWDGQDIQTDAAYQSADQFAPQYEGYKKVVFWNKNFDKTTGERIGLPCWIQVTNGGTRNIKGYLEPILAADTAKTVTISSAGSFDTGSPRYVERDGQHQQVRFYPRPIGYDTKKVVVGEEAETIYSRQMVIRYYKKPQDILLETDTPEMPYEFHQLIVYRALENIYLKLGQSGLAQTYSQKYNKDVKELQKRYVDKIDAHIQRGQFNIGQARGRYDASQLKWGK